MDAFILPMLISGLGRQQRAAFLERMMPAMLPVPDGQRLTMTALMAEQQVKRQSQVDEQVVAEAVQAGKLTKADELAKYPTLQQKYLALSEAAKARIFPPTAPRSESESAGASRKG
jgi:hypothetical protein